MLSETYCCGIGFERDFEWDCLRGSSVALNNLDVDFDK